MLKDGISRSNSGANDDRLRISNLSGRWRFSIGDNPAWAAEKYDDTDWEQVYAPSTWEDQGFYGYNGFAWYRKKVTIDGENEGIQLYLYLGYIDDVDEVYFNGQRIGSTGSFPPNYSTAYNARREYYIPEELINYNQSNMIAVKVYDSHQKGGIISGDIGIFKDRFPLQLDYNLQGMWKFHIGDKLSWKKPDISEVDWDQIFVPGKWEDQGYREYDGYAWYRTDFVYNKDLGHRPVLVMGKIDDLDQVYVNGTLVGSTGYLPGFEYGRASSNQEWAEFRGYYVPEDILKLHKTNTVSVRVYDSGHGGGIYEGPVGLISQKKYIQYWRDKKYKRF